MTIDLVADATIAKSAILSIGGCVASKVCKSFHDQLAQANLVHRPVDGDNNCGFYSVGVSLAASTIEHTPGGTATARDKQWDTSVDEWTTLEIGQEFDGSKMIYSITIGGTKVF